MRKVLIALLALAALSGVAAATAVGLGARAAVGDCVGAPATGAFTSYRARAADGNCLQGYAWAPPGAVRGVVVVVHGLHDHARRYGELAASLGAAGFAVVAQDHRGHGGSGGAPQRLDSIDQVLGDIDVALGQARKLHPGVAVFLHGHSMGGLAVAQYVARKSDGLAGAVVSSAALTLPADVTPGRIKVLSAISAVAPGLGLEQVDEAKVVRTPPARAALAADTLLSRDKLPARTVAMLLDGVADLQPRMATITLPLLVLHGGADQVTDPAGSRMLHGTARSADKSLRLYDRAQHDLLHEPEAPEVTRPAAEFFAAHAAPRS